MPYAYIENNVVRELIDMTKADFEKYYPADFRTDCVTCAANVQQGWIYDGKKCAPPPGPTLNEVRATAVTALATRRWQAETAGIVISAMPIPTDRDSQALITGAVAGALIDPTQVINWKTAATDAHGVPISVPLDASTLKAVALAVRAHVQACFDLEAVKGAQLAALPDAAGIQTWLDTQFGVGWPS